MLPFSVTPSVKQHSLSTGILTCHPSITPFGLTLGPDLPWAESPGPGTLGFSAGGILALLIATYLSISSCGTSNAPYGTPSSAHTMLLYHLSKTSPQLRHVTLAPLHLRRKTTSPVSYYAFFKGWLLLSQPPGCHSSLTTFTT